MAFWDYTGKGEFRMIASIKSQGALTLYLFEADIQPSGTNPSGVMNRQSDSSFYLASDVFTSFKTTSNFLVVGCPTCQSNNGYLFLHSLPNLKKKKGVAGDTKY